MDATNPTERTALEHDPETGKRAWQPPTIEVIDVPAQTEGAFGTGTDTDVYS